MLTPTEVTEDNTFPYEIWNLIFYSSSLCELFALNLVSKPFHKLIQALFEQRNYPQLHPRQKEHLTWIQNANAVKRPCTMSTYFFERILEQIEFSQTHNVEENFALKMDLNTKQIKLLNAIGGFSIREEDSSVIQSYIKDYVKKFQNGEVIFGFTKTLHWLGEHKKYLSQEQGEVILPQLLSGIQNPNHSMLEIDAKLLEFYAYLKPNDLKFLCQQSITNLIRHNDYYQNSSYITRPLFFHAFIQHIYEFPALEELEISLGTARSLLEVIIQIPLTVEMLTNNKFKKFVQDKLFSNENVEWLFPQSSTECAIYDEVFQPFLKKNFVKNIILLSAYIEQLPLVMPLVMQESSTIVQETLMSIKYKLPFASLNTLASYLDTSQTEFTEFCKSYTLYKTLIQNEIEELTEENLALMRSIATEKIELALNSRNHDNSDLKNLVTLAPLNMARIMEVLQFNREEYPYIKTEQASLFNDLSLQQIEPLFKSPTAYKINIPFYIELLKTIHLSNNPEKEAITSALTSFILAYSKAFSVDAKSIPLRKFLYEAHDYFSQEQYAQLLEYILKDPEVKSLIFAFIGKDGVHEQLNAFMLNYWKEEDILDCIFLHFFHNYYRIAYGNVDFFKQLEAIFCYFQEKEVAKSLHTQLSMFSHEDKSDIHFKGYAYEMLIQCLNEYDTLEAKKELLEFVGKLDLFNSSDLEEIRISLFTETNSLSTNVM